MGNEGSHIKVRTTTLKLMVPNAISTGRVNKFEMALFNVIGKHQGPRTYVNTDKQSANITDSKKVDLKRVLFLTEEIANPIYLYKWNHQSSVDEGGLLLIDGLAPDIAWKLQFLLDGWHENDPMLFPKISVKIYNMRLQLIDRELSLLHDFLEEKLDFDRILSLKDLFNKEERKQLYSDEIALSVFKNHIEIYLKKDMEQLSTITFNQPRDYSKNGYGILHSDQLALVSISNIIKPKLTEIFMAILSKAEEMGFANDVVTRIRENFTNNFSIQPLVGIDESAYLEKKVEDLFLRSIHSKEIDPDSIKTDFDVLHYIRYLSDSNISIEELLTTTTKFVHLEDISSEKEDESYQLAKKSEKPIIQTRYFLHHPEKLLIRTLDLSGIRLLRQPNLRIFARLKYMNTLILDNGRASAEFNIELLSFGELPQLEILSIRNCGLQSLTKAMFDGCSILKRLYATGNEIQQIDEDSFIGIKLDELHIDDVEGVEYHGLIKQILDKTSLNKELRYKRIISSFHTSS